jgi:hypothetical protein
MAQSITIDKIFATVLAVVSAAGGWMATHYAKKIDSNERRIDHLEAYKVGHEEYEKWQQKLLEQLVNGHGPYQSLAPSSSGQSSGQSRIQSVSRKSPTQ